MTLVRVRLHDIEFPNICPVCGDHANIRGFIGKSLTPPPRLIDRYYGIAEEDPLKNMVFFTPLVCPEHKVTMTPATRVDLTAAFCGSLSLVALFLSLTNAVLLIYDGLPVPIHVITILSVSALFSYIILSGIRSTPLSKVISIKKVNNKAGYAILKIKHKWYVEAFLSVNPHKAVKL